MANRNAIRTAFRSVFTSGNRGLVQMVNAIEHVMEHGDTSLISVVLDDAEKYASDSARTYQSRIKMIFKAVFPDASFGKTKDGHNTCKRGENMEQSNLALLRDMADAGYSLIGQNVVKAFGSEAVSDLTAEQQAEKRLKALIGQVSNLIVQGVATEDQVLKAIRETVKLKRAEQTMTGQEVA